MKNKFVIIVVVFLSFDGIGAKEYCNKSFELINSDSLVFVPLSFSRCDDQQIVRKIVIEKTNKHINAFNTEVKYSFKFYNSEFSAILNLIEYRNECYIKLNTKLKLLFSFKDELDAQDVWSYLTTINSIPEWLPFGNVLVKRELIKKGYSEKIVKYSFNSFGFWSANQPYISEIHISDDKGVIFIRYYDGNCNQAYYPVY